jgi:hypothetical protein
MARNMDFKIGRRRLIRRVPDVRGGQEEDGRPNWSLRLLAVTPGN